MSINNQLKGINIENLQTDNGKTLSQRFYEEVKRLKDCIQSYLDFYLMRYPPVMYKRTGKLISSLQVDDFLDIQIVNGGLEMLVKFNKNANHMSGDGIIGWDGTGEEVNVAFLLNYGYQVKRDVWFKDIENFGYRIGGYFVEDGIDEFNRTNPLNIKITIVKPSGYLL